MFDYILENFSKDSKFINDLEGVENYLDSSNVTAQEKVEILKAISIYNEKMRSLMMKENKELEKIISKKTSSNTGKELVIPKEEIVKKEDIITLGIDAKKYVTRIISSKSYEEIKNILPLKGSLNYNHIINVIILGLYEEVVEYKRLLIMDRANMPEKEVKDIKVEINNLLLKINYLKRLNQKSSTIIEGNDDSINTLLFLKTTSGNYSIFSDLKEVAAEHYNLFHTLLTDMMNDKFKNLKRFNDNNAIQGLLEVRYNQARITFMPVAKNKYVILDMFIKKTQIDAAYQAALKNKYDLFKENYLIISNLVFNDEYIEENKKVLDSLLSTLEKDAKVKRLGGCDE